jgi:phosphate-selective porin OprO/OprP
VPSLHVFPATTFISILTFAQLTQNFGFIISSYAALARWTESLQQSPSDAAAVAAIQGKDSFMLRMLGRKMWRKMILLSLGGLSAAALAGEAYSQDIDAKSLLERIERLERQNQELQNKLATFPVATEPTAVDARTVENIIDNYMKGQAEAKKKEEAKKDGKEPEFTAVGSDLNMKGQWNNALWFYTPSKDFAFRVRGRIQQDWGWFAPSEGLEPRGWFDGAQFRRARIGTQGTVWEVVNWTTEWDFAEAGVVRGTDIHMDVTGLPFVGNFRAGHFYEPFALEEFGTSDLYITFLERSVTSDAFNPDRNIGIMLYNNLGEGYFTWATGLFRANSDGHAGAFDSGDGEYSYTTRLNWNPWYTNNGRCAFMFGGAYSYRSLTNTADRAADGSNATEVGINNTARFRTRIPVRVPGTTGANSERVVDTGSFICENVQLFNLQSLLIFGSFSLQSEAYWVHVRDALEGDTRINPSYSGFYVEASYFLTGENRRYKRTTSTIDRPIAHEPFFFVKSAGEGNRKYLLGRGAWELVARYEYIDLGNDIVTSDFQGREQDIIVGLNWWLNPNFRVQLNYVWAEIDGLNTTATNQNGIVHAFGARFQWDW